MERRSRNTQENAEFSRRLPRQKARAMAAGDVGYHIRDRSACFERPICGRAVPGSLAGGRTRGLPDVFELSLVRSGAVRHVSSRMDRPCSYGSQQNIEFFPRPGPAIDERPQASLALSRSRPMVIRGAVRAGMGFLHQEIALHFPQPPRIELSLRRVLINCSMVPPLHCHLVADTSRRLYRPDRSEVRLPAAPGTARIPPCACNRRAGDTALIQADQRSRS